MIIDAHNHLGGPDFGDKAKQSAEELVAALDEAEVEQAIIFPFNNPDPGTSFQKPNDIIAEAVKKFPRRLIGFGRVDPNQEEKALAELERVFEDLGLKGLKLHPKAQKFGLHHPYLLKILEKVAEIETPLIFDSGTQYAPPKEIGILARHFPSIPIIMAHMRGENYLEITRHCPNVYLGTTGTIQIDKIDEAIDFLGAEKIIAGSDSPYFPPQLEFQKIDLLKISPEEKALIKGENILQILKI